MKVRIQEIISAILVVAFIIVILSDKPNSEKTVNEVYQSVTAIMDISGLNKCPNSCFKKEFSLNPNDFDGVIYYASEDAMDVRELLVVRLKKDSPKEQLLDNIQKRVDKKITLFGDYAPEEEALLKSHVLECTQGFVLFAVCRNPEQTVQIFKDSL